MSHGIDVCACGTVIVQCRCPGPHVKRVVTQSCPKCTGAGAVPAPTTEVAIPALASRTLRQLDMSLRAIGVVHISALFAKDAIAPGMTEPGVWHVTFTDRDAQSRSRDAPSLELALDLAAAAIIDMHEANAARREAERLARKNIL